MSNVQWKDEISEAQLERVKSFMQLLVHPMNVGSKVSSFGRGRGVLVEDWFARDVLRAAELDARDAAEVAAVRRQITEGKEPLDPVVLAILETSEHKLTVLDGYETVCAVYAEDWNGLVRAHLLRLPI